MAMLMSVNVGLPRDIPWNNRTVYTGAWKQPVTGRRMVRRLNVDGDGRARPRRFMVVGPGCPLNHSSQPSGASNLRVLRISRTVGSHKSHPNPNDTAERGVAHLNTWPFASNTLDLNHFDE
jgi:hypothetical protein